ncbi:MAG: CDP-glycerol glycerophosphotransferase family protein [Actinomycetota bacterium]
MNRANVAVAHALLQALYTVIRWFTRVNPHKVVFLGRRMDSAPLDFELIIAELARRDPRIEVAMLSKLVKGDRRESFAFVPVLLRSLYHLATSKVCVLDSYWPAVSMLNHAPDLIVYQIWHSLGKIKQSGRQSLDRSQGRSSELATAMRMHEGYDYVVAGAEIWNPYYRASFGVDDEQLLNIGLPRADYLVRERERIAARIHTRHPELEDKPVVLYAPTFRRGEDAQGALMLTEAIDRERFHLVIKKHDSDTLVMPESGHIECPDFTATELLTVADYVITDYSSIALEAALIDVKTFYFLYDFDRYFETNGVNIDIEHEMPGCVFRDVDEVRAALAQEYPIEVLQRYKATYLFPDPGHSTTDLVDHMFREGGL